MVTFMEVVSWCNGDDSFTELMRKWPVEEEGIVE